MFLVSILVPNSNRFFDRFERVTATDNIGGLGLGLYMSRQIVDAHGGKIWVESEPGEGSSFYVDPPLHPTPAEQETSPRLN